MRLPTLTAAVIGLPLDFLKLMVSTKSAVKAGTHTNNLEEGEDGGGGKSISACKF